MTPDALFLWALAREAGIDGFRLPPAELAADYAAACAGGVRRACDPAAWRTDGGEVDLRVPALGGTCSPGDPVACVIAGWASSRGGDRAWLVPGVPLVGSDPLVARELRDTFRVACDAGLGRGCLELGITERLGFGTYVSERMAGHHLRPACEAGEPEACRQLGIASPIAPPLKPATPWARPVVPLVPAARRVTDADHLRRAASLGHAQASFELADSADDDEGRRAACAAGSGEACRSVGDVVRGCALGLVDACVTSRLQAALDRGASSAEAATEMDGLCATSRRACMEAAFLREGSPIVPIDGGSYPTDKEIDRWIFDLREPLRKCQLERLHDRPDASGWLEISLRVGADGRVVGVWIPESFDEGLAVCARKRFLEATFRPPTPGEVGQPTLVVTRRLPLFLAAKADLSSAAMGKSVGTDLAAAAASLEERGAELDACVVRHDDPRFVTDVGFDTWIKRDGRMMRRTWTSADVEPATRACLDGVLAAPVQAPALPIEAHADLHFLQLAEPPHVVERVVVPPPTLHPLELRTLVLMVERAKVDGGEATLTSTSMASVRAAHEELARFVEEHTRGGVVLRQEFRTFAGRLFAGGIWEPDPLIHSVSTDTVGEAGGGARGEEATEAEREEWSSQASRFFLDPYDLPDELVGAIEPLAWDAVFVWVPLPDKLDLPALGTTWTDETLRGATFTAGAVRSEGELVASAHAAPFELPLHELWHQLRARASLELGVTLPDNHQRLEVEDHRYNPRIWNSEAPGTEWYAAALGKVVHPEVWADLGRMRSHEVVRPDDLALTGVSMFEGGARSAQLVNDGYRSMGGFRSASSLDRFRPSDDAGWWAVSFEQAYTVTRVVARLAESADAPPTVKRIAIEGRDSNTWEPLAEVVVTGATVDVTLDPEPWEGVRIRVLERAGEAEPLCAELEVYGP